MSISHWKIFELQVYEMSYGSKLPTIQKMCVILSASDDDARRISTGRKAQIARWVKSLARLSVAATFLFACALPLPADTASLLRRVPAGGCYCHCAESKVRGGCVKMCEPKKYAYRWWATSCAKPHMSTPRRDSHAGPRFPHSGRTEHAKL